MKNVTFYKFDIEPENNLRLDQIISSRLPEYSRSTIKNWIKHLIYLCLELKEIALDLSFLKFKAPLIFKI